MTNVNEAPINIRVPNSTGGVSIDENSGIGHEVGMVTAEDPDNEVTWQQNLTFALESENTTRVPFALADNYIIETTANLDFEVKSSYVVNITAFDNGIPVRRSSAVFTITVSPE